MKTDNKSSLKKKNPVKKQSSWRLNNFFGASTLGIIFFLFILAFGLLLVMNLYYPNKINNQPLITLPLNQNQQIIAFNSADDFKAYLEKTKDYQTASFGAGLKSTTEVLRSAPQLATDSVGEATPTVDRVSETNVQVAGIDEPDIVKTDGQNIFFSQENYYGIYRGGVMPMMEVNKILPPDYQKALTQIIKALPANEAEAIANLEATGNLLLKNNILVILTGQDILAYDVSNAAQPEKKWSYQLGDDYYLQSARLFNEQIYILTQSNINEFQPCPLRPLSVDDRQIEIACSDIYHPVDPTAIDTNFSALKLDLNSGDIVDKVSFVGAAGQSILYMSTENLYISYDITVDSFAFLYKFTREKMFDLLPAASLDKLSQLQSYDISQSSKLSEFYNIINKFELSLSKDARLQFETEMQNRLADYVQTNQRQLSSTGLIKIALKDFDIAANGSVPGRLLNQFSLDEYQGNLRLATTIGDNWWAWGLGGDLVKSANDVYILNEKLNTIGSIQDLGLDERIYSARFIEERAYLVTFKQVDPFYILDLSDPKNPKKTGELKIPGFSSYLHPLAENKILGVGSEDSKVKLSYFDVSDPNNPQEIDKYLLNEYWTEVSNNHHAFLQDAKHQVFFIPGGQGAYVLSYQDNKLSLVKAIDMNNIKRALYINDNLYVLGNNELRIFDENTWTEIKSLSLEKD